MPYSYKRLRKPSSIRETTNPFFNKNRTKDSFFKPNSANIQAKLAIGKAGDAYEKEADSVANQVVNQQSSLQVQQKPEEIIHRQAMKEEEPVQKQAMEEEEPAQLQAMEEEEEPVQKQAMEEEEEPTQLQAMEEEEEPVQAKANDTPSRSANLKQQLKHSHGKGNSLPQPIQSEMSHKLGYDFRDVTIHTDSPAAALNQNLRAKAFTQGKDIYFNQGKYNPKSPQGKHLLAHELTHVIQQSKE